MLTVALLIVLLCQIGPGDVLKAPVFSSGMVGLVALFGVAWLADTFVVANEDTIVDLLGDLVHVSDRGPERLTTAPLDVA